MLCYVVDQPPCSPGWQTEGGTIWQQRGVSTQCAFGAESTFEIFCTVGTQPKFALVDTFGHASSENRQNAGKESTFPTT